MRFATALSEAVGDLERVQDAHQAVPCVDAALRGAVVTVNDLTESDCRQRWPEYCDRAMSVGVRAVAGIPMLTHDRSIGAMNLYDTSPRCWSATDIDTARILADLATGFVVHASELEVHRNLAVQLQQALESRVVIEQAKGIIAQANGISVDQAFRKLRQHARNHNVTIAEVSAAVVDLGLRP